MSTAMCTCASGCDRHPCADPGVWPPCRCWCHQPADVAPTNVDAKPHRPMLDSIGAARRFTAAFVERSRRGDAGLAELAAIVTLHAETGDAVDAIARHLLTHDDCSYREIGAALRITPQAAAKRYPGASTRTAGGQPSRLR